MSNPSVLFKKGDRVIDTWFPRWRTGIIQKVLKTRTEIFFPDRDDQAHFPNPKTGLVTYDKPHMQFLRKVRGQGV